MARVLVTGASDFIGRAVVTALVENGHSVRAAAPAPPEPPFPRNVEARQHPDLQQTFEWRPLLEEIDSIVHLAGLPPGRRGGATPALYDEVNHQATVRLAAAAARVGIQHFVLVSSIRGQSGASADHALTERDAAAPTDALGRSKLAAEEAVRDSGVPFTILRPVPIYGPGVKGVLALLLRGARSPWPLPLKDFINRRSLLSLDNFVSALTFVLATPACGETYVIADPGVPPRFGDMAATLRQALGRRPLIVPMETHYVELALRSIGRADLWEQLGGSLRVDPTKLIAAGWRPVHDTRAGLAAWALETTSPQSDAAPLTQA
jgi:nucleoside-diphosphate-sugar epimerase